MTPATVVMSSTAVTTATDSQGGMSTAQLAPEPCQASSTSLTPMKAQMTASPLLR